MHRRYLYILLALLISACSSRRKVGTRIPGSTNGPVRKGDEAPGRSDKQAPSGRSYGRSLDTESYIQLYQALALREMKRTGIPASITLAQGILESGNGNSRLARQANNHFGIKCTPDWRGGKTYKDDDRRNDCFRVYSSAEDSFHDHSEFLQRNRYSFLFDLKPYDYKGWARGLKKAGYATNPRYADLLIDLIERYELHRFDRMDFPQDDRLLAENQPTEAVQPEEAQPSSEYPATPEPPREISEVETEQPTTGSLSRGPAGETAEEEPAPAAAQPPREVPAEPSGTAGAEEPKEETEGTAAGASGESFITAYMYTVRQGDTLYSVSRRFNVTVEDLKQWNDLKDNRISIGQELKVSR